MFTYLRKPFPKGWMQTWWVHARYPRRYWRRTKWRGWIARDLIVGGAVLAALAYPFLVIVGVVMLIDYVVTGTTTFMPAMQSPLHTISIASGLFAAIWIKLRGLARRGRLRYAWVLILTPVYWGLLSAAAWRALLQLRSSPFHWEKTEHGLARRRLTGTGTPAASSFESR